MNKSTLTPEQRKRIIQNVAKRSHGNEVRYVIIDDYELQMFDDYAAKINDVEAVISATIESMRTVTEMDEKGLFIAPDHILKAVTKLVLEKLYPASTAKENGTVMGLFKLFRAEFNKIGTSKPIHMRIPVEFGFIDWDIEVSVVDGDLTLNKNSLPEITGNGARITLSKNDLNTLHAMVVQWLKNELFN